MKRNEKNLYDNIIIITHYLREQYEDKNKIQRRHYLDDLYCIIDISSMYRWFKRFTGKKEKHTTATGIGIAVLGIIICRRDVRGKP